MDLIVDTGGMLIIKIVIRITENINDSVCAISSVLVPSNASKVIESLGQLWPYLLLQPFEILAVNNSGKSSLASAIEAVPKQVKRR